MHPRYYSAVSSQALTFVLRLGRVALLLLPAVLLALGTYVTPNTSTQRLLGMGSVFLALSCVLALVSRRTWTEPIAPSVIVLYTIGLIWVLMAQGIDERFLHLSQAVLLVVPLGFFALQCLFESGAPALRRARQLARSLASRREWPADLAACGQLPEVKAFREALHIDASPALDMLSNPRPQVRVAALAALEYRQNWRLGQPDIVLRLAQRTEEPAVRAAAINALANIDNRILVEALAEFLCDPMPLVRQTAAEALLWNTEHRWSWIRHAVRRSLADPVCQKDGPLRSEGKLLSAEAVADLTAWATERGLLCVRAAQTLGLYYGQVLAAGGEADLIHGLRSQLMDVHAPAILRLELARLLHQHRELDTQTLNQLLDPSTPAPVRLISVEALLAQGPSPPAVAALHELARLPNREIALVTADVVQRRLGVDLGLPRGQPPPPIQSRLASEVARRVLQWASRQDNGEEERVMSNEL